MSAAQIYFELGKFEPALEYCQRALDEDNLLEEAYQLALRVFAAMENRVVHIRQNQRCVKTIKVKKNPPPNQKTIQI